MTLASTVRAADKVADPTDFQIIINEKAASEKSALPAAEHLRELLAKVQAVAPKLHAALKTKVTFWITDSQWQPSAAVYHPNASWLAGRKMNVAMASGIEITNIDVFMSSTTTGNQPMAILHELVHAYHNQILGDGYPKVIQTFNKAISAGKYKSVHYDSLTGPMKPAYALTNAKEYLSEISEAYFGTNDYFPFNRAQLKAYDRGGYNLVKSLFDK